MNDKKLYTNDDLVVAIKEMSEFCLEKNYSFGLWINAILNLATIEAHERDVSVNEIVKYIYNVYDLLEKQQQQLGE